MQDDQATLQPVRNDESRETRFTVPDHSAAYGLHATHQLTVPLWCAAHGRTGDKGNRSNISVIAWDTRLYPLLEAQITEEVVARQFAHRRPTTVRRYALPQLGAMNFVLDDVLDGGVNDALNLDSHGKALSFLLLDLPLTVPTELLPLLKSSTP